ncbi:MAG: hypothetical protein WC058_14465, partial [Phycisphaeraceae bacterium]
RITLERVSRVTNVLAHQKLNVWWNSWRELIRHQTYYQQRNSGKRNHGSYESRRKKAPTNSS